jgi:hypothetical protein
MFNGRTKHLTMVERVVGRAIPGPCQAATSVAGAARLPAACSTFLQGEPLGGTEAEEASYEFSIRVGAHAIRLWCTSRDGNNTTERVVLSDLCR